MTLNVQISDLLKTIYSQKIVDLSTVKILFNRKKTQEITKFFLCVFYNIALHQRSILSWSCVYH